MKAKESFQNGHYDKLKNIWRYMKMLSSDILTLLFIFYIKLYYYFITL